MSFPVPAVPAGHGVDDAFHHVNHMLRTVELERVPKGAARVLSVGANGRWYFDWFEACVGPVEQHVGVEAFEPMPVDLPPYVRWLPETADHMVGVADGSLDLVFAGQTTEHLWSEELAGFLEEAHRVLGRDGLLVLDSPNRLVTEHLHWSHGGHTVELSPDEISELVTAAGFRVESMVGIWRCELDGRVLGLEEGLDDPGLVVRRVLTARDDPDESFIWWLTARRTEEAPEPDLWARVKDLFERHWDTRASRGLAPTSQARSFRIEAGDVGTVGETLPFPLRAGRHQLTVELESGSWDDVGGMRLELVAPGERVIHVLDPSEGESADPRSHTWHLVQSALCFAVVVRFVVDEVRRPIVVTVPLAWEHDV